jgi:hypothetical protein
MDLGILTWVYSKLEANITKQDMLIQKSENCRDELIINAQSSTIFFTQALDDALMNEDFKEYYKDITPYLRKLTIAARTANNDPERRQLSYNGFTPGQIKNSMHTYAYHIDAKLPTLKQQTKKWSYIGMTVGFIMLLLMAYCLYHDFGSLYHYIKQFFIGTPAAAQKPYTAVITYSAHSNMRRF